MICGPTPAEEKNGGKGRLSSPFWAKGLFSGAFTFGFREGEKLHIYYNVYRCSQQTYRC